MELQSRVPVPAAERPLLPFVPDLRFGARRGDRRSVQPVQHAEPRWVRDAALHGIDQQAGPECDVHAAHDVRRRLPAGGTADWADWLQIQLLDEAKSEAV